MKLNTCENKDKSAPGKKKNKLITLGILSLFIVAIVAILIINKDKFSPENEDLLSAQDRASFISETVDQLKEETEFPILLDEVTTWVDVTGGEDSLVYHYTLEGFEAGILSQDKLSSMLKTKVCVTMETRTILDSGISLVYEYADITNDEMFVVPISSEQCEEEQA
jgi:hypothetical protein